MGSKCDRNPLPADVIDSSASQYDRIGLIFIDALGWRFIKRFTEERPIPQLLDLCQNGKLSKITSIFPSTTSVHVTCINTGFPIWESGICEWNYYESRIDQVITPLPFCTPFKTWGGSLQEQGVNVDDFIKRGWFYDELVANGVDPVIVQKAEYAASPYNRAVGQGARVVTFKDHSAGLQLFGETLLSGDQKKYAFYYFEEFDSIMHREGVTAEKAEKCLRGFFEMLEEKVLTPIRESKEKVLLLFTADHGMTHMDPDKTVYLEKILPEAHGWLKTTAKGQPLYPCGSSRDLFLHVKPECLEIAFASLQSKLSGVAEVFKITDLMAKGYFGADPSNAVFQKNIGDILIAPYAGESVYWLGDNLEFKQIFLGHHGGLSADEMESFFLAYEVN